MHSGNILGIICLLLFNSGIIAQVVTGTTCAKLDANNLNVKVSNGGMLLNDRFDYNPAFEVPSGSGVNALFEASYAVLGLDDSDSIRGNMPQTTEPAFSPGLVDFTDGSASYSNSENIKYDRIYKVRKQQVRLHKEYYDYFGEFGEYPSGPPYEGGYEIPEVILNWPAHATNGNNEDFELAPFFDNDCCGGEDGVYEPQLGDYPAFRFEDNTDDFSCTEHIPGDIALFWVECDVKDTYSSTPSYLEFENLVYAFSGHNGVLSNVLFHRIDINNRTAINYHDLYFTKIEYFDLGCYTDDFIGSDVQRGLGYVTNSNSNDESCMGSTGYGANPPSFGFDLLKGPGAPLNDEIDNDRDGEVDEPQESWILNHSIFIPFNLFPDFQDPEYHYLAAQSRFPNGVHLSYQNAYDYDEAGEIEADMIFPNDSDPLGYSTGEPGLDPWSEWSQGYPGSNKRMWLSSGPFDLGASEEATLTGAYIWARDEADGEIPFSLDSLLAADDLVQEYYDNCFEDVPCQAPTASIEYSSQENEFNFESVYEAQEYQWDFGDGTTVSSVDSRVTHEFSAPGSYTVCLTTSNLCGTTEVCTVVSTADHPSFEAMDIQRIEGVGNGRNILHLNEASEDSVLENGRVVHPVYKGGNAPIGVFHESGNPPEDGIYGVQFNGVESTAHWKIFKFGEVDTVESLSTIGDGAVEYIEEFGVYVYIDLKEVDFVEGLDMEIIEPLYYEKLYSNNNIEWLTAIEDKDLLNAENWIANGAFHYQLNSPPDSAGCTTQLSNEISFFFDRGPLDAKERVESVFLGEWSTNSLARHSQCRPFPGLTSFNSHQFIVNDVNLVLTSDRSNWTRSLVLDFQPDPNNTGNRHNARNALSVDKYGRNQNDPNCNIEEATFNGQQVDEQGLSYGMGWFPGYAIDLETGERCNIVFAENPDDIENNGNDMIWNPNSQKYDEDQNPVFGGSHFVYILNNQEIGNSLQEVGFDNGQFLYEAAVEPSSDFEGHLVGNSAMWITIPLLKEGYELTSMEDGLIPTETEIKLRIEQPYNKYLPTGQDTLNNRNPLYRFSPNGLLQSLSSTEEVSMDAQLIAYPNPSSEQIMIKLPKRQKGGEIRVFDSQGRLVWFRGNVNGNLLTIGVQSWKAGVYVVKYSNQDTSEFCRLVVE